MSRRFNARQPDHGDDERERLLAPPRSDSIRAMEGSRPSPDSNETEGQPDVRINTDASMFGKKCLALTSVLALCITLLAPFWLAVSPAMELLQDSSFVQPTFVQGGHIIIPMTLKWLDDDSFNPFRPNPFRFKGHINALEGDAVKEIGYNQFDFHCSLRFSKETKPTSLVCQIDWQNYECDLNGKWPQEYFKDGSETLQCQWPEVYLSEDDWGDMEWSFGSNKKFNLARGNEHVNSLVWKPDNAAIKYGQVWSGLSPNLDDLRGSHANWATPEVCKPINLQHYNSKDGDVTKELTKVKWERTDKEPDWNPSDVTFQTETENTIQCYESFVSIAE